MRSKLLRTTTIAVIGVALAGTPAVFAQSTGATPNDAAPTQAAPSTTVPPEGGIDEGMTPPNDALAPAPTPAAPDAGTSAAAPAEPAPSSASVETNMQPAGTVLSEDIKGAAVQTTRGEDLAVLSDLVVAPAGRVTGAILTVGGVLGVGGKEVIVPWEKLTVGSDGETITLAMSEQQLEQLPAFQPLPKEADASSAAPAPAPAAGQ